MRPSLALLAVVALIAAETAADTPSFLFILADDIGWGDFGYNGGNALTPHLNAFARAPGSILLHDAHSQGTVCSPTRASVLTGRSPFRDCVDNVYNCSDPTECPGLKFKFAPNGTYTFGNAVRDASVRPAAQDAALSRPSADKKKAAKARSPPANNAYESFFSGKWHLGNLFADAASYGGVASSPVTHGFDTFNCTLEVAPTATTNCHCAKEWIPSCIYGHNEKAVHCNGQSGPVAGDNCCFNYWWRDDSQPHGVNNLTNPVGQDDSQYVTNSFEKFLNTRQGKPFAAQLSYHNCHIPYIGTEQARDDCRSGRTCQAGNYSDAQLDFYACLNELDASVGRVLQILEEKGYRDDTLIFLTTDNGPEGNCQPEGFCTPEHFNKWPGSSGPLRGRKRDTWEGGHRVPGIVAWPKVVGPTARESFVPVVTSDFLPTVMEVLGVSRPASQAHWGFDGTSLMPLLKGQGDQYLAERGIGWMWQGVDLKNNQYGFRYGNWKLVRDSQSCSNEDCKKEMLFNLDSDLAESVDLSKSHPDVFEAIKANFTVWHNSVMHSRVAESTC